MTRWAPHLFREQALEAGLDLGQIDRAFKHYSRTSGKGVAPVLSLRHLALSSGVEYAHLRSRCARRPYLEWEGGKAFPYSTFAIKKRSGGKRVICVPAPDLMHVQRWINRNILACQPLHPRSFAYRASRSISDCAAIHLGCRWLVKIDLAKFFESISERRVFGVFRRIGYDRLVAFELARLCTRVDAVSRRRKRGQKWEAKRREVGIADYECDFVGYLPQGAPTSPGLSNIITKPLDVDLAALSEAQGWEYSRYSDDIYVSTADEEFGKPNAISIAQRIRNTVRRHGFEINHSKTAIAGPGHRRLVLGLLVDGPRLRLSRQFRRGLSWHYRHCVKDPTEHATVKGFDSVLGLKNHVEGLLSFASSVDPEFVGRLTEVAPDWPV